MTPSNDTRAEFAAMAVTMYALRKEGHNHYDFLVNMCSDMMTDACHLIRREGGDPDAIVRMMLGNFKAEEAQEQLGQELTL